MSILQLRICLESCLTHQRLRTLFGGRLKESDIGWGFLLNGVSPLGGLTPLWLGCRGDWQEQWGSWCSQSEQKQRKPEGEVEERRKDELVYLLNGENQLIG